MNLYIYVISTIIVSLTANAKIELNPLIPLFNTPLERLSSNDIRTVLAQEYYLQVQYLEKVVSKTKTIKELNREVGKFSAISNEFSNIIHSREGEKVITLQNQKILHSVQQQLQPWIASAKKNFTNMRKINFPDIERNGINAVTMSPYYEDSTTLKLLIGSILPRSENYWPIKLLIDNDADVNIPDRYGVTPLINAVSYNIIAIVNLLLLNNARVNDRSNDGWTPLLLAIKVQNINMVRLLLKNNANISLKTNLIAYENHNLGHINALQFAKWYEKNIHPSSQGKAIVQVLQFVTTHGYLPQASTADA